MSKVFNAYHRQELKSFDGEFLYELHHSYELSPRLSEQILQTAKMSLFQGEHYQPGQIEVVVAGLGEKSGKQLERVEKRRVTLTVDNGTEDLQALQAFERPCVTHAELL